MGSAHRRNIALIVDDEVFARLFVAQVLEDEGYLTLEAENTVEALDVLDRNSDVSLLVTDVNMPGDRDGLALASAVSLTHPTVSVVVMSGAITGSPQLPAGARFLAKPFTAHVLGRTIRQFGRSAGD